MRPNPLEVSILSRTKGRSIKEYRLEKIRETLRLVYENSPYYKEKYQNFDLGAIGSFEDFEKLPFMDAEDLTLFGPKMLCCPKTK